MADNTKTSDPCDHCGMSYDKCAERLRDGGLACCGGCGYTGTHKERLAIPFSTPDEGTAFPDIAKEIVATVTHGTVYVVWFAYVLGSWKAVCSTDLPDGRYYEVTFKKGGPIYLDTYVKIENKVIETWR